LAGLPERLFCLSGVPRLDRPERPSVATTSEKVQSRREKSSRRQKKISR
jgi:hypothetical protein